MRRRVCGLRGFPVGGLGSATTNDSATSPRPLGTLPRPCTAYQASLDIAARLAAADPGNSSLEHERQLLAHELGELNRAIDSAVTAARPAAQRGHAPPGRRSRPLIYKEPDSAVLRSGQGAGCGSTRSGKRIWRMQNSWCQRREGRGRVLRSKSRRDSRPPLGCGWHGGGFRYGPAVLGGRLLEVAGGAAARAVAAAAGYRAGRAGDGGSSGSRREPSRPPADRSELHAAQRSAHLLAQRGGGTISHVAIRPGMHPSRLAISRPRQWPDDWLDQGDDADRREAVRWTESRRDAGTPPARFGRWQQVILGESREVQR